jgi:glycosyltransferase involved in cell wall biosynthesis
MRPPTRPALRVLAISHSAVALPYREKWRRLSARKGWALRLLMPSRWPEGGSMLEAEASPAGLDERILGIRLPGRIGFFSYQGLDRAVAEFRPDLVYCEEEPYCLAALQAARAARRCGAAFVFFSWENIPRRFKPPLNWVRQRVQGMSAGALLGSSESLDLYRAWGFQGPARVIPQYGVDTRLFRPSLSRPGRPFRAAYVGRLVEEKGVDLFVEACAKAGLPGLVVGRGPEEASLKALASGLGAEVEFRPFVPFEQRHLVYRQADALVLPSRTRPKWKEQFGRVIIEAGSCGLPTVGSHTGAIPEVIGGAGMTFPEGDVKSLAARLQSLARDGRLRRRLGALARARALKQFDSRVLVQQTGAFLEGLIGNR